MSLNFTQLQSREVICIESGRRLGFVSDIRIEMPEGRICAIVVPGPCRYLGVLGRSEDYIIPWSAIRRIGPDILLVEARPEDCRVRRAGRSIHKGTGGE